MSQTKLLSSHMAIVATLGTFDLNNTTGLQNFAGAAAVIPMMKLNPEHVSDFLATIDARARATEVANQKYWKSAVGKLKKAREQFVHNNRTAHNGSGHVGESAHQPGARTQDSGETARG